MKSVFFILLLLLAIPTIYASVEIGTIKAYVDNERITGADETGGTIAVKPDSILDMIIEVENTENTTSQAKLKGTISEIDGGSDIIKEQAWYDINADSSRSRTMSFHIPDDAAKGNYNMALLVYYKKSNGTEGNYNIDFIISVGEKVEIKAIDLESSFNNLTTTCNAIIGSMNTYLNYEGRYDNCSLELATVKEERGSYKNNFENCDSGFKTCSTEKIIAVGRKDLLEEQVKVMMTYDQCRNTTNTAVRAAEKDKDNMIMGIIAGGFLLWMWQNKKKQGATVQDKYYYEKK